MLLTRSPYVPLDTGAVVVGATLLAAPLLGAACASQSPAPANPPPLGPGTSAAPLGHGLGGGAASPAPSPTTAELPTLPNLQSACSGLGGPSFESCPGLIGITPDSKPVQRCDETFERRHGHVDCSPDDLLCMMRAPGYLDTALYQRPPKEELVDCLRECIAGQGASCYRVAQRFAGHPKAAPRTACQAGYAMIACELGLPQACDMAKKLCGPGDDLDPRSAYARLSKSCDPAMASWECFYQAHCGEMSWGTGTQTVEHTKGAYEQVCAAPCPPPPERCYQRAACDKARRGRR